MAYERRKGLRLTDEFFRKEDIPTVSVLEPLKAHGPTEDTYMLLDGHLNEIGNRVVADTLAAWLMRDYFPAKKFAASAPST